MALPAEKGRYTFADALTWSDDERAEIVNGEPAMMAPPTTAHQLISGEIFQQLGNYLEGKKCRAIPAPFAVRLFEKDGESPEDVDTMVELDITIVCDPSKLDKHGCKGAPDMVVEILSPSTQRHNRLVKLGLYQRAGVREYWIVDPMKQTILVYDMEHSAAPAIHSFSDSIKVNIYDNLEIDFSKLRF